MSFDVLKMGVDIQTYRARIGSFRTGVCKAIAELCSVNFNESIKCIGCFVFIGLLLLMAGIESNPGPWSQEFPDDFPETKSVYISGLPDNFDEEFVEFKFSKYGTLINVEKDTDSSGCLILTYNDTKGIDNVRQASHIEVNNIRVDVKPFYANIVKVRGIRLDQTTGYTDDLRSFFETEAGDEILDYIIDDSTDNSAYVIFKTADGARTVIEKREVLFQNQTLAVFYVHQKDVDSAECSSSDQILETGHEEFSDRNTSFEFILQKYELESKYPNKIKVSDVVAIALEEGDSKRIMSYKEVPWKLLKGLINVNRDARDKTIDPDITRQTFDDLSEIDDDAVEEISPLDIFNVVFQCCDSMLQQLLFQKLYLCKLAVPFIQIRQDDNSPIVSVWPLRALKMHSKIEISKDTLSEIGVLEIPTNVVTVARIGRPEFSKSILINELLSDHENKVFFNHTCIKGTLKRSLNEGFVDMFWLPLVPNSQIFDQSVTFLNLRGDVKRYRSDEIKRFATDVSDCFLFVSDMETILNDTCSFQHFLLSFAARSIILVIVGYIKDESRQCLKDLNVKWKENNIRIAFTHQKMLTKNVCEIAYDLSMKLKEQLKPFTAKPLERRILETAIFKTDEEVDDCKLGKAFASSLLTLIDYDGKEMLEKTVTPISSITSKELGNLIKLLQREKNEKNREKYIDEITKTRQGQLQYVSEFIKMFTECITNLDEARPQLYFFLGWIDILFRNKCTALQKYVEETFKYDYILREISFIYDTLLTLQIDHKEHSLPSPEKISKIFSKLLIDGYPLELIEGNSFYLPSKWIQFVLNAVSNATTKAKFLSLSVLGVQSSGKSTLLNTMFGSQFSASAGRCTKGIHIQCIPIQSKPRSSRSPFDYVLVLDTEGLRAPELYNGRYEHDNELATMITGIGDISLLNIMGEHSGEMYEILQVIVHAFLRLKTANERLDILKCCYFVHQNVIGSTARGKREEGLRKLTQSLDLVTKEAAELQGIPDLNSFNDIIKFEMTSNVWYLSNLWQGTFPMTSVNREYSSQVCIFRTELLKKALEIRYKPYKSISDLAIHITELWQGVLNEDSLFNFRSNLEFKARIILSEEIDRYELEMENTMYQYLYKLTREKKLKLREDNLESVLVTLKETLIKSLDQTKDRLLGEIIKYFENNDYKDITYALKDGTIDRFKTFCKQLHHQMMFECNKIYEYKKTYLWTEKVDNKLKERLLLESVKLAKQLRERSITVDDALITEKFNEVWDVSSKPYFTEHLRQEDESITEIFRNCLYDIFRNDKSLLKSHLENKKLTCLDTELKGTFVDLDIKQNDMVSVGLLKITPKKSKIENELIEEHFQQLFENIDTNLAFYCCGEIDITEHNVKQFLNEVNCMLSHFKNEHAFKFRIDKKNHIKILVHISRRVMYLFDQQRRKIKDKRISCIHQHKAQAMVFFLTSLDDRKIEEQAATELKRDFTKYCQETVQIEVSISVKNVLTKMLPLSKLAVLLTVMEELVLGSDFKSFQEYINSPNMYIEKWIKEKMKSVFINGRKTNQDIYYKEASKLIERLLSKIKQAIEKISVNSIDQCLKELKENLNSEDISISCLNTVKLILNNKKDVCLDNFKDIIVENLDDIESTLKMQFADVSLEDLNWKSFNPLLEVVNKLKGCDEHCPYCAEPCVLQSNHKTNHECFRHKPRGCRGIHTVGEKRSILSNCTLDVTSDKMHSCKVFSYKCNEKNEKPCWKGFHRYSHYKDYFPSWDIRQTFHIDTTFTIWKWFFVKFRNELSDKGLNLSEIPSDWANITKDRVLSKIETSELT